MFGKLCTHQYGIYHYFGIVSGSFPALTPSDKHKVAYLALGNKAPPVSFYQPFHFQNTVESVDKMELDTSTTYHSTDNVLGVTNTIEGGHDDKKNQMFEEILESLKQHHEKFGSSVSSLEKFKSKKYSFRGPVGNIFKYCR
ncbi:hypothetical protein JTE90_005374 [Oedothorax gibbosus]|uniref:Uncharacterized protein n=1 Tax=Oedothorax gibbosus TaxID=931172 RepID=A0AAV6TM13_9ARAC|nr:hypothetical protein JTE90_005374 [Oedothorax gibbosus]